MKKFEEVVAKYDIPEDLCTYLKYKGKPYFSIKYEENGEHFMGFGTYKPEVLSKYLHDYFIANQEENKNILNETLEKIQTEIKEYILNQNINQNINIDKTRALCWCLDMIDKYKNKE